MVKFEIIVYINFCVFIDNKYFLNKIGVVCYDFRNFIWFEYVLLYILYIDGLK